MDADGLQLQDAIAALAKSARTAHVAVWSTDLANVHGPAPAVRAALLTARSTTLLQGAARQLRVVHGGVALVWAAAGMAALMKHRGAARRGLMLWSAPVAVGVLALALRVAVSVFRARLLASVAFRTHAFAVTLQREVRQRIEERLVVTGSGFSRHSRRQTAAAASTAPALVSALQAAARVVHGGMDMRVPPGAGADVPLATAASWSASIVGGVFASSADAACDALPALGRVAWFRIACLPRLEAALAAGVVPYDPPARDELHAAGANAQQPYDDVAAGLAQCAALLRLARNRHPVTAESPDLHDVRSSAARLVRCVDRHLQPADTSPQTAGLRQVIANAPIAGTDVEAADPMDAVAAVRGEVDDPDFDADTPQQIRRRLPVLQPRGRGSFPARTAPLSLGATGGADEDAPAPAAAPSPRDALRDELQACVKFRRSAARWSSQRQQ